MCKTAVFFGEELARYGFGESHPFNSNRIYAFWSKANVLGLVDSDQIQIETPTQADEETLLTFHDKDYLTLVKRASVLGSGLLDFGDTPAFKGVFEASSYVVGTTLKALDLVMNQANGILHAFNPIGGLHHARRGSAGGFCVFNDIGIAGIVARQKYGVKRIAYIDIDAHHGDGVYYEFDNDPLFFIADLHEDGRYLFPGTGSESEVGIGGAKGTKINISMKPGSGDNEFISKFGKVEEFIEKVARPELIIFQCGADCIKGDPLTHLQYSSIAHKHAANILHRLSHRYCDGRLIALGGGGYNLDNIANSWNEVVMSLMGNTS
ncbi:MAG TPA: acetoin utilization protein AcuC [Nitrososphaeraceae archaeon]|jgi:acetoin utilization protein AcuC